MTRNRYTYCQHKNSQICGKRAIYFMIFSLPLDQTLIFDTKICYFYLSQYDWAQSLVETHEDYLHYFIDGSRKDLTGLMDAGICVENQV